MLVRLPNRIHFLLFFPCRVGLELAVSKGSHHYRDRTEGIMMNVLLAHGLTSHCTQGCGKETR